MKKYFVIVALILAGCEGTQIIQTAGTGISRETKLAVIPSGNVAGEAIGIELAGRHMQVINTGRMADLMKSLNIDEKSMHKKENLSRLSRAGIDAVLFVKTLYVKTDSGFRPDSISIEIRDTKYWEVICGLKWNNCRGVIIIPGMGVEKVQKAGVSYAVKQIVNAILDQTGRVAIRE